MQSKFKSRKFIQSSAVIILATILCFTGDLEGGTWVAAIGASQAIYAAGNVKEKRHREGDIQ